MTAPRKATRSDSFASNFSNASASSNQSAALLGATTAFGRPAGRPAPKVVDNGYSGANGALVAANTVRGSPGTSPNRAPSKSPARPPLRPMSTGGSVGNVGHATGRTGSSLSISRVPNLEPPTQAVNRGHSKSPSQQAASLAAARAPTPSAMGMKPDNARIAPVTTYRPSAPPKPRRLSSMKSPQMSIEERKDDSKEMLPDDSPIPPTTSLVDLFERKASTNQASTFRNKPEPIIVKSSADLPIKSPKPVRTSGGGITSMIQMEVDDKRHDPTEDDNDLTLFKTAEETSQISTTKQDSSDESFASASEDMGPTSSIGDVRKWAPVPSPLHSRTSTGRKGSLPSPLRNPVSDAISIPKPRQPVKANAPPLPDSFSPPIASPAVSSLAGQYHQRYPVRRMTPNMTGDQLADAMVAGSLASSRAPSPRKNTEPPPPPARRRHSYGHLNPLSLVRTPSPAKTSGMRHTMRKRDSSSDDEDGEVDKRHPYMKHKGKRIVRKHPNKHHEGDRKRWRDAVTERERKRYEGLWAANKGMHVSFTHAEHKILSSHRHTHLQDAEVELGEQVSNIIVRDIWSRSKLPEQALEAVWDLVDEREVGRLNKEEFVVGMWLVDQKLKGRKLPVKVSGSVWASVRGLQGIKIRTGVK